MKSWRRVLAGALVVGGVAFYWNVIREPVSPGDRAAHDLAVARLDSTEVVLRNGKSWPEVADLTARVGFTDEPMVPSTSLQDGDESVVVELLSAPSKRDRDDKVRLELRARASTGGSGATHGFERTWGPGSAVVCRRFDLDPWGDGRTRDRVDDCETRQSIAVPNQRVRPTVTAADRATFETWLATGAKSRQDELSAKVSPGLSVDVTDSGGQVFASVFAAENLQCVLGRRDRGGVVAIWSPPRVTVQPGEAGCSASTAEYPVPPPH